MTKRLKYASKYFWNIAFSDMKKQTNNKHPLIIKFLKQINLETVSKSIQDKNEVIKNVYASIILHDVFQTLLKSILIVVPINKIQGNRNT